jgi:uncharacterized coiled-coil DUF342 family protein
MRSSPLRSEADRRRRDRKSRGALLLSIFLFSQLPLATFAGGDPLPTNPDDYDVAKYQRAFETARSALEAEKRKLDQLESTAEQAKKALAARQALLANLDERLRSSQSEISRIEQEATRLQAEVARAEGSLSSLESQVGPAKNALQDAEGKLAGIQAELDRANRAVGEKQAAHDAKAREVQPLLARLAETQKRLETAKSSLEQARSRLNTNASEKTRTEAKVVETRARAESLAKEAEKAKRSLAEAEADTDRLQPQVGAMMTEMKAAEARLRQAQSTGQTAEVITRLEADAAAAREKAASTRQAFVEAQKRKALAAKDATAAEQGSAAARAETPRIEERLRELVSEIERDRSSLAGLESSVSSLLSEVASLSRDSESARAELARLKSEADRVKSEHEGIRSRAGQIQREIASKRQKVSSLEGEIATARKTIAEGRAKADQQRTKLAALQNALPTIRREREEAASRLESEQREANQSAQAANEQKAKSRAAQEADATALRRLEVVRNNLKRGMEVAEREGRQQGREAARREGQNRGTEAGARDGALEGERRGRFDGENEGIRLARTRGAQEGTQRGSIDGTTAGARAGQEEGMANGATEGRERGLSDGASQGQAKGAAEGQAEGARVGHASGAYQRGAAEGAERGKARGEKEGHSRGTKEGIRLADQEAYGAKLQNVVLPMAAPEPMHLSADVSKSEGMLSELQNRFAALVTNPPEQRAGERNSSRAGKYPIPELDRRFEHAYRETYQTVYDAQYQAAAADAYERAFQIAHRASFERALRLDYTAHYQEALHDAYVVAEKSANDRAYEKTYDGAYRRAFEAEFGKVFPGKYDETYSSAYEAAHEQGRQQAMAADLERGRRDGEAKAYAQSQKRAYDAGKSTALADRRARYDSAPVLLLAGSAARDANGDGIMAPGEALPLDISVKNFGRVSAATESVRLELSVPSAGLEILAASVPLPELPAVSKVLLQRVPAIRVLPTAAVGSKESVVVSLVANGEVVGSAKVQITVGTTHVMTLVEILSRVSANADNSVRIVVKNKSSKPAIGDATVEFSSTDGLATVSETALSVGLLQPGQSKEVRTSFRFVDVPTPEKLSFQAVVRVGDAILDQKTVAVKSAERFAYNASSRGVLVVNSAENVALAQQARKATELGLDLFDERQEGPLPATVAAKYARKLIVVPEANASYRSTTVKSVSAALAKGAHLLLGTDANSVKTGFGAIGANAERKGVSRELVGLKIVEKNAFASGATAKVMLTGPAPAIGAEGLANALLVAEVAIRPTAEKARDLLVAMATGDSRSAGLLRTALVSELVQEMKDDVALSGRNFERSVAKLRLSQVLALLHGASPGEKTILGGLYGELESARLALAGKESRKLAIAKLLEPLREASGN